MLANNGKCRSDASNEGWMFHDEWTFKFGVIEHESKALCCICDTVITMCFYNINRHFESNHNNWSVMKENEKLELTYLKRG